MAKKFDLTRRRALAGIAGLGAVGAGGGAGTFAYFSDEETSTDNTIQSGTLDLTVTDGDTIGYTIQDVAPGDTSGYFANVDATQPLEFNLELENVGTIDDEVLVIYIENTTSNAADPGDNFAEYVLVRNFNFLGDFVDGSGNPVDNVDYDLTVGGTDHETALSSPVTLADISGVELRITDPTGAPPLGVSDPDTDLSWSFKIDEDMGNDFQGAELDTTYNFALLQDSSQNYTP